MPQLRLHSPAYIPGLGSELQIPGNDVTVGRSPDNQLVIPESSVSAHHARIQQTPQGWILSDLGNTNGIWIGVRRVDELPLTPGQLFRIGGVALEFIEDGQAPAVIDEHVDPDGPLSGSSLTQGSGVRQTGASLQDAISPQLGAQSGPTQVNPPDWELPADPQSQHAASERVPVVAPPPSSRRRGRTGRLAAGLLGLTVLGFALTLGAVFALRWLTKVRRPPTRAVATAAATVIANEAAKEPPRLPEITLLDQAVDTLDAEQRVEVPGLLSLQLPARALHKATHIVVARAPETGAEFCHATELATNPVEIATAYNAHWAQPATIEMSVDLDRLAKTGVPSMAIGFRDAADQAWQLLPTVYDQERRIARTQIWQPGFVALFFAKGPEVYAASEHFALLLEPKPEGVGKAAAAPERPQQALNQLESALTKYREMGFRVAEGLHWACASHATPNKSAALLPVFPRRELNRKRSPMLARSAFATLVPAYLNSGSVHGREFWFAAMYDALANFVTGQRAALPSFKRLANPLVAEDWPSPPLFLNLMSRFGDPAPDLFRIWSDTTHVMSELDAKAGSESQSPVLAVDLALQQITKASLLEHYARFVNERLLAEQGRSLDQLRSRDACVHVTQLPADSRSGSASIDVPSAFTARWSCIVIEPKPNATRMMHLQLAAEPPSGVAVRLLRIGSGQVIEPGPTATRPIRLDLRSNEVLVLSAINANMSQPAAITLKIGEVTPEVTLLPAEAATARVGQEVQTTLSLAAAPEELKTVSVQWDFGDGTPNVSGEWTVNASGQLRVAQSHVWTREGSFNLRATVIDGAHAAAPLVSASRTISVQALRLDVVASGSDPVVQSDIKLHAKASGPLPESPAYRFDFGDGTSPITSATPDTTHQFTSPGEYTVRAELLSGPGSGEVLATARTTLSIRSGESPTGSVSEPPQEAPNSAPNGP